MTEDLMTTINNSLPCYEKGTTRLATIEATQARLRKPTEQPTVRERTMKGGDPWERLSTESPQAFDAFATYRDLGPGRSLTKVAQECTKSRSILARWSRQHSWVVRSQAFDAELDREWLAERSSRLRASARRNADIASAALEAAAEALNRLAADDLTWTTLPRLIEVASKLEQLALGSPTSQIALTGPAGGAVQIDDVSLLTDEERFQRMRALRDEIDVRLDGASLA